MKRFFSRRRRRTVRKKPSRRFTAACLSLGLATAWGNSASADATLRVDIAPQQTLSKALIYYGNNISTGVLRSLGTLPGGQTSTIFQTIATEEVPFEGNWTWDPDSYGPGSNKPAFYAVIGLYSGDAGPGVSISFPNQDPIDALATWSSIFERQDLSIPSSFRFTEQEVVDGLTNTTQSQDFPPLVIADRLHSLLAIYGEPNGYMGGPLATEYGQTATMVNFSNASFGGTVNVSLVPEPAACLLLVSAAGIVSIGFRSRRS